VAGPDRPATACLHAAAPQRRRMANVETGMQTGAISSPAPAEARVNMDLVFRARPGAGTDERLVARSETIKVEQDRLPSSRYGQRRPRHRYAAAEVGTRTTGHVFLLGQTATAAVGRQNPWIGVDLGKCRAGDVQHDGSARASGTVADKSGNVYSHGNVACSRRRGDECRSQLQARFERSDAKA